eukprot:CAMPEP_0182416996 /NCGR_PEP_ID=MMETSP1167-20130531/1426_1 /TAXON_ID=2988 /ORGANISM="Mallomonas Sp, Strain CCMP3275" /LENGTH=1143 /DNA_ID=CAMNT_0024590247 /DNA_START=52 /DNA_END=3483 /DNA_ORIENTATION=+
MLKSKITFVFLALYLNLWIVSGVRFGDRQPGSADNVLLQKLSHPKISSKEENNEYSHIIRSKEMILPDSRPARELGEVIEFDLFDGTVAIGSVTKVVDRGVKGATWVGTLKAADVESDTNNFEDRFTLTCFKEACVGRLVMESTGSEYEIQPGVGRVLSASGKGVYRLSQIKLAPEFKALYPDPNEIEGKLKSLKSQENMATDTDLIIDMGVMYTEEAKSRMGWSDAVMVSNIHNANDGTNLLCGRSETAIRYRIVFIMPTKDPNYTEPPNTAEGWNTLIYGLKLTSDGILDEAHDYRDQYAADFLLLVNKNSVYCGSAYLLNDYAPDWAVSNYNVACVNTRVWAHELGHQQGCEHDRITVDTNQHAASFQGYGNCWDDASSSSCRCYSSVMVYQCNTPKGCTSCTDRDYYSNVNVINAGNPTGTNVASCSLHINAQKLRPITYRSSLQPGGMIFSVSPTSAVLKACVDVVISGFKLAHTGSIISVTLAGVDAKIKSKTEHSVTVESPRVDIATTEPGAVIVTSDTGRVTTLYGAFSFVTGSADGSTCTVPAKSLPDDYKAVFEYLPIRSFSGAYSGYFRESLLRSLESELTISMWITTSTPGTYLVSLGRNPLTVDNSFLFHIRGDGKLCFHDYSGGSYGFDINSGFSTGVVTTGTRTHIAFVREGTTGRYYINGALSGTKTASKSVTYNNEDLAVGYAYARTHNNFFNGDMEKLRIYKKALSASQVLSLKDSDTFVTDGTVYYLEGPKSFTGNSGILHDSISTSIAHYVSISLVVDTSTLNRMLISIGRAPNKNVKWCHFFLAGNGKLSFFDYNGANGYGFPYTQYSDSVVPLNQKVHVGFVKNARSGTYYINGVEAGTFTASSTFAYGNQYIGIGYNPYNDGQQFVGSMENVKIFPRSLTAQEMGDLFLESFSSDVPTSSPTNLPTSPTVVPSPSPTSHSPTLSPTSPSMNPSLKPTLSPAFVLTDPIFNYKGPAIYNGLDNMIYLQKIAETVTIVTVSMWIQTTDLDVNLLSLGASNTNYYNSLTFIVDVNGYLNFYDYGTAEQGLAIPFKSSNDKVNSGARTHVGIVKDGVSLTFYINGAPSGSHTASFEATYLNQDLILGYDAWYKYYYFTGQMDHIKVYNIALTDGDMNRIYNTEI